MTNFYSNQGLLETVSNALGRVLSESYDSRNRITNSVDPNGVTNVISYDDLDRVTTRIVRGGGTNSFRYSVLVNGSTSENTRSGEMDNFRLIFWKRSRYETSNGL